MATTPTEPEQTVLLVYQLLNGRAPRYDAFVNSSFAAGFRGGENYVSGLMYSLLELTDAQLAAVMVRGAGIANAGVVDYLAAVFGSYAPSARGQVLINLAHKIAGLEGDANFGADAVRFNRQIAANFVFATDPRNLTTDSTASILAFGSGALSVQQDAFTGSTGDDLFRAVVGIGGDSPGGSTTLNARDFIDGGTGTDTLWVDLAGSYSGGAEVRNVETLRLSTSAIGEVAFDYNAVAPFTELDGFDTVVIDRIVRGQAIAVNHLVKHTLDSQGGNVLLSRFPILALVGDGSAAQWGAVSYNYRALQVEGAYQQQDVTLESVNDGTLNIGAGIEYVLLTGVGSQRSTLVNSTNRDTAGPHGAAADIVSAGALFRVFALGTAELGKRPGIQAGTGLTDRLAGTDGGIDGQATSLGNSTASNLLSVESRVLSVDASPMDASGQIDLRFMARTDGAGTNVTFTGPRGGSYVEFALGNVSAQGGAANDTFAFIESAGSAANATFGSGDTLAGGAGADTLQLGINGIGRFDLAAADFANVSGIETLDLRGAVNTVAVSAAMAGRADTGATLTVRTDRIVQTSLTDAANAPGFSFAEDNAVSVIDLTGLAPGQSMLFLGGSGADRIVLSDATATGALALDGGANKADAGAAIAGASDYDTLTLLNSGVLSGADLLHIQGFEALLLDRNTAGPSTFGIQLTADFVRANTSATDRADTRIDDTVFHIGAAMRNGAAALGTGDAVVLDISGLLDAGRTSLAASLAGRGIDVHVGSAQVRYLVDGAAASAAQVALVTKADAAMAVQSVELVGLDGNAPVLG